MENDQEVASIAKGLTKAQRIALARDGGYIRTAHVLFDAGLYGSISYDKAARYAFLTRPTALGLAIRTHLLANTGDA
jgi:hypothetical protein